MTNHGLIAESLLTSQTKIRVIDDSMEAPASSSGLDAEKQVTPTHWSIDDIIADPAGYDQAINQALHDDARAWVAERLDDLARARGEKDRSLLRRLGAFLVDAFS